MGRRRVRGGEKRERKDNGVFRGLVCMCVCVRARARVFREVVLVLTSMYSAVSLTLVRE